MTESHTRVYRRAKIREMKSRKFYSGFFHFSFTFGIALFTGIYSALNVQNIDSKELLIIPFILIYANFVEYFTHRIPLHRRIPGLGLLYDRHGIQHHRYFTDRDITIKTHHEMYYVLFPSVAILIFIPLMAGPLAWCIGVCFGSNAGWLTLATASIYFAVYETFHLANHLPKSHWIHRIPGVTEWCRFHRLHHDPRFSKRWNFNVTFPLADWLMKTLR